jgi:hypothetical protein
MADIEDGVPLCRKHLEHAENARDLCIAQGRGRLVENQQPRVARQQPRDLDKLLLTDCERAYRQIEVPGSGAQSFERLTRAAAQVATTMEHRDVGAAQPDIVENGEPRGEAELLGYETQAQSLRVLRTTNCMAYAIDRDRASVGRENAHQQFDESALAGPVLAADGADFTRA